MLSSSIDCVVLSLEFMATFIEVKYGYAMGVTYTYTLLACSPQDEVANASLVLLLKNVCTLLNTDDGDCSHLC